jgi:hypothetical protein
MTGDNAVTASANVLLDLLDIQFDAVDAISLNLAQALASDQTDGLLCRVRRRCS